MLIRDLGAKRSGVVCPNRLEINSLQDVALRSFTLGTILEKEQSCELRIVQQVERPDESSIPSDLTVCRLVKGDG